MCGKGRAGHRGNGGSAIRADKAAAAAPRFVFLWLLVALLSLADLALLEKGMGTGRRTLSTGSRGAGTGGDGALWVLEDAYDSVKHKPQPLQAPDNGGKQHCKGSPFPLHLRDSHQASSSVLKRSVTSS